MPRWYAERLGARVRPLLERHGLARTAFRTAEGDYPGRQPAEPRIAVGIGRTGPEPTLF